MIALTILDLLRTVDEVDAPGGALPSSDADSDEALREKQRAVAKALGDKADAA